MTRRWVLPLLILSGFAGLAYELLWVRLLALHLGSTTISFSVVLGVFFGGLAAGARWAGKRSLTVQRPLRAYALLEGATGLLGLLLYPLLTHLGPLVAKLDPGTGTPALLFRLTVAVVVLTPPTFLMGATLPFISVATIRADQDTGKGISLVYGFNTAGACLGAYGLTFWLLPALGVFGATLVTVALNVLVAGAVLAMTRRADGDGRAAGEVPPSTSSGTDDVDPKTRTAVIAAAFLGGLVATGAQVIWARYFAILLGGTAYGIGSVLVSVLVGIALGSFLAARTLERTTHPALTAVFFIGTVAFGLVGFTAAAPLIAYLASAGPNAELTGAALHHADLAVVLLALAVPTVASGASLPALTAVLERSAAKSGQSLATLYTANTIGCILGSMTTGLVLLPTLGSATTLYLMFLLLIVAVTLLAVARCRDRLLPASGLLGAMLIAAVVFPQLDMRPLAPRGATRTDYFSFRRQFQQIIDSTGSFFEGDVATVRVMRSGTSEGVALNGLGQGSHYKVAPQVAFESVLVATVPWQHARRHDRGLVVGLGSGGTAHVLLDLGVKRLEVAELEAGVVDAVNEIWKDKSPLLNERLELIRNDARNYLLRQSQREPGAYDFVTSMPAHPWVASALFTREFFELAAANLAPEGVFTTWFGASTMQDETIEGLLGAFTGTFPHWLAYFVPETGAFYLVGSRSPLRFDVARITELASGPAYQGFDPRLAQPTFFSARLTAHSTGEPAQARLVSTDDNGLIEFGLQLPRSKPLLDALTYLPNRGLAPELIDGADPDAFLLETLEVLLSTPKGRLPHAVGTPGSARRLANALKTSRPGLSQYGHARIALMAGKRDEALALARTLPPPLAARMNKFLAATEPDEDQRRAALLALPRETDVRLALLGLGATDDLAGTDPTDDDAGAALFRAEQDWRALPVEAAARDAAELLNRLQAFNAPAGFELCAARLAQAGQTAAASQCRARVEPARQAAAARLVAKALDAGTRERWAEALAWLRKADAISPLDTARSRLFLQTAVKLGAPEVLVEARALMRTRGFEGPTIDGLVESFREEKAGPAEKP